MRSSVISAGTTCLIGNPASPAAAVAPWTSCYSSPSCDAADGAYVAQAPRTDVVEGHVLPEALGDALPHCHRFPSPDGDGVQLPNHQRHRHQNPTTWKPLLPPYYHRLHPLLILTSGACSHRPYHPTTMRTTDDARPHRTRKTPPSLAIAFDVEGPPPPPPPLPTAPDPSKLVAKRIAPFDDVLPPLDADVPAITVAVLLKCTAPVATPTTPPPPPPPPPPRLGGRCSWYLMIQVLLLEVFEI
uniref:Uncharacterized protein n=1 Tax=Anopheles farauti TaxID=69004 RepID=A0A182QWA6_9DIPT